MRDVKIKRRRGRPSVADQRDNQVVIRLNDREMLAINRYLKKKGLKSRARWIREVIIQEATQLKLFED